MKSGLSKKIIKQNIFQFFFAINMSTNNPNSVENGKKLFSMHNNSILSNFSVEEMAKVNALKQKWLNSLSKDQKNHHNKQVYVYLLLCENFGKEFKQWTWPLKDGQMPTSGFKKKIKSILGYTISKDTKENIPAKIKMTTIGCLLELVEVTEDVRRIEFEDADTSTQISKIADLKNIPSKNVVNSKVKDEVWKKTVPAHFIFELLYWIHVKGTTHAGRDVLIRESKIMGHFGEYLEYVIGY